MASDRLVTPEHVLKAVMEYERRGSIQLVRELEKLEPDLMEYLLESLTRLYHQLTGTGLTGREARKVHHLAEKTALVCLIALRNAQRDLWGSGADDPPRDPADPPVDPSE
jgi:hypothetical protein